jgi:hypothetical protein
MKAFAMVFTAGLGGALLGGCQTATVDPGASILVDGDYALLAECYARTQPNSVSDASVARKSTQAGFRTVTVTSSAPSRAAAELVDVQDSGLATSYSVAFTEQSGYKTKVTGAKIGPGVVPFFWQDVVLPQLRNCTGNPTLG